MKEIVGFVEVNISLLEPLIDRAKSAILKELEADRQKLVDLAIERAIKRNDSFLVRIGLARKQPTPHRVDMYDQLCTAAKSYYDSIGSNSTIHDLLGSDQSFYCFLDDAHKTWKCWKYCQTCRSMIDGASGSTVLVAGHVWQSIQSWACY